ncbi:SymE family type I addiction module toxin [Orbus wheelerorum]|uniref:SymE family type I addiction module toxin n=1 Tax=Orbus wheelerorum TaxID=3074111 RepID=UPI00370D9717
MNVRHKPKASPTEVHYSKHPVLHLKGNLLNELGFTTGKPVTITAKKGKLVVEITRYIV